MGQTDKLAHVSHRVDFCVVGGGLAGLAASVAAARRGAKVALVHDRPVLGGNASSEIRMWVCGAAGANNRETGIIEEIALENLYRNPRRNDSIWDSILSEKVHLEENITLLLNCSCNDLRMEGARIRSVRAWQLTTQTWHTVEADLFADCSGDSILAPLSGAEFRWGREAASEFREDIAPRVADRKTMGMSCLIQARETDGPQQFIPPAWARKFLSEDDLPNRGHDVRNPLENFWWMELGGEGDTIHDTETVRDELLKVAFGIWDHIKNHGDHGAENWALEWVGFLPGKRESRRYVGDHILTQNDVRAGGRFDDLVAYGGWSLDDHHPAGINYPGRPTEFNPAPSPYGIPYRSLYSRNIENLLFAGRNISATHAAMSSTRVMATCATMGQAIGVAAALAARHSLTPRGVCESRLDELQQALMDDDCYLPWRARRVSPLTSQARAETSEGDPEPLRNGVDRPVDGADNGWSCAPGSWVEYLFEGPRQVSAIRLVFDSDLNRPGLNTPCGYPLGSEPVSVPETMTRAFRIEALDADGSRHVVAREENNYQRRARVEVEAETKAIRLVPEATWGARQAHVFAFDVISPQSE